MADAPLPEEGPDAAEVRLNRLLNLILEAAVEALGFDAATVTARHGSDLATVGATDQRVIALDDAQYQSGAGAVPDGLGPTRPHLAGRRRRARGSAGSTSAAAARDLGVHSTLSMHLPVDSEDLAASLNLYSKQQLGGEQRAHRARRPILPSSWRLPS